MGITIQIDDATAALLKELAAFQNRNEADIVREALAAYLHKERPLPIGMGKYHSGHGKISEEARDLLREAVKEGRWP